MNTCFWPSKRFMFERSIHAPFMAFALIALPLLSITAQDSRVSQLPEILERLDDESPDTRMEAANAIRRLGPQAISAAPKLIGMLEDTSINSDGEPVAQYYSRALAGLGPLVVPELLDEISTEKNYQRSGICEALHQLGPSASAAVKILIPKMSAASKNDRWAYTYVFEGIGPKAATAVPQIIEQLDSEDFQLQLVSCRALAAIGPKAKDACPELLRLLDEGNLSVKGHAAMALGNIGIQPGLKIPENLARTLEHPHFVVRERVLEGIGRLGRDANVVLPTLENYMEDSKFNAPVDVALAYFRIGGEPQKALDQLTEIASHFQNELEAVVAIGKMKTAAAPAIPMLIEKLDSEDPDVAYEACFALAAIGDPKPAILAKLDEVSKSSDQFLAGGAKRAAFLLRAIK
ncbi:MAG: HEAT repeat domain-containing protein [Planctomycetota bacterium]|nr:HEAT repeat domain-containing protein [Planctomycetota bacterium]